MFRKITLLFFISLLVQSIFAQEGNFRLSLGFDYKSPDMIEMIFYNDTDEEDEYFDEEYDCTNCFMIGGFGITLAPELFVSKRGSLIFSYTNYPRYRYAYDEVLEVTSKALVQSYSLDLRRYRKNKFYQSLGVSMVTVWDESENYFNRHWGINLAGGGPLGEKSPFNLELKIQTAQWLVGFTLGVRLMK